MNRKIILLIVLLIVSGIFAYISLYNNRGFSGTVPCSVGDCAVYKVTDEKTAQMLFADPTRTHTDFGPDIPPDFPKDLLSNSKPTRILQSYTEKVSGNINEGEINHTQSVYMYVTKTSIKEEMGVFKKFLETNDYEVKSEEASVQGVKNEAAMTQMITVSVSKESDSTSLVTVSVINSYND